jgi:hypothetical protein
MGRQNTAARQVASSLQFNSIVLITFTSIDRHSNMPRPFIGRPAHGIRIPLLFDPHYARYAPEYLACALEVPEPELVFTLIHLYIAENKPKTAIVAGQSEFARYVSK